MPRKYLLPLTVLVSLIFSWLLAPFAICATDIPLRLTADKQVIYPQESTTVKAEVYAEESGQWLPCGSGVGWDLSNNTAGNYVYNGDTLVYTAYAENSLHLDQPWDSAKTVIKATYSVRGQDYEAELPVLVYPLRAIGNPVEKALVWLRTKQKDDGSFVANAGEWAVSAVAAAGYNPVGAGWQKNGNSHLSQLESTVRDLQDKTQYFRSLTDYARVAVSVAAAAYYDSSWRARLTDFGGVNLIAKIKEAQDENGHFGKGSDAQLVNSHVWAVLALKAAGEEIPNAAGARSWLEGVQNPDGGWGYTADKNDPWGGCLSDSNDTADAVRALVALGGTNKGEGSPLKKALDYLSSCQADDGGFIYSPLLGGESDAGSDARVILALRAAGEDPYLWKKNGNDPVYHLLSLQAEDGSFLYQAGTPPYGGEWGAVSLVADAITALAGVPLLELPPPARPPGSGTSDSGTITVAIIVRGLDGAVMYDSRPVQLGPGEQTPLGALKKTGASIELGYGGAYVAGIDGLREKQYGATSGWCYRVNGEEIQASAADYRLKDGDCVEWVYVRSLAETSKLLEKQEELNAPVPVSLAQQNKFLAGDLRASEEALAALEKLDWFGGTGSGAGKPVYLGENEAARSVVVTGERPEISPFDIVARKKDLAENRIDLNQKVTAEKGAVIADAKAEMALIVPAEALKTDTEISVQKKLFSFAGEAG
ncbi:MAG: DUF4430 domain-containing protein, partial [Firmicutes bacterium]|nr:DUF4430 domain-containing protein [Bacillota bacterium]